MVKGLSISIDVEFKVGDIVCQSRSRIWKMEREHPYRKGLKNESRRRFAAE